MSKFLKAFVATILVSFGSVVFAQNPNPPTILCGSYRVAQNEGGCDNGNARAYDAVGNPTQHSIGQVRPPQNQWNQVAPVIGWSNNQYSASGWASNQERVWQQQPRWGHSHLRQQQIPSHCQLVEKPFWKRVSGGLESAALSSIAAALGGVAVDRWRGTGGRWTKIGAAGGAAYGFSEGSNPGMVLVCQSPVAVQQQQVLTQQVEQQQIQQIEQRNPCAQDPGTAQGILNIPGHPKNGQTVCAKPGDTNISKWL